MKRIFSLSLICFLVGCQNTNVPAHDTRTSLVDTKSEVVRVAVPHGWKLGSEGWPPGMRIQEYVPADQSADHWSQMVTVLVIDRHAQPDIDTFFQRFADGLRATCEGEILDNPPERFLDGRYPAGIQMVICGKDARFGTGNFLAYKLIEGKYGFFQVQIAWDFPPAARSQDLPVTQAMRDEARARLAQVHLCDRENPGPACAP